MIMPTQIALILIGCIFSALMTFAIVYLREIKKTFEQSTKRQDERIVKIEDRISAMPEKYVMRDDFVRWSIGIDKKIDDVARDVKALIKGEGNEYRT
jgi:hypothetical protein